MHVLVCGAGPVGAVVALLLAAEGHQVTVLDQRPFLTSSADSGALGLPRTVSDRLGATEEAPVLMLPGAMRMVSRELPETARKLASASTAVAGGPDLVAHRTVVSSVLSEELSRARGVRTARGVGVVSLLTGTERIPGRPHIQGVLTDAGEAVLADLVVDAAGRESRMVRLLSEVGAPRPLEERQDTGFRFYTRHFGSAETCAGRARWSLHHFDGVSVGVLSAGHGLWSMTLCIGDEDLELYLLAELSAWNRAARLYAPLLPRLGGSPLPGVWVTSRLESCYRRFVLRGRPVATGTASVGDAWAAINPLLGLGPSMGLLHAVLLRDAVRQGGPEEVAIRFDRLTEDLLAPLHHRITDWEEGLQAGDGSSDGPGSHEGLPEAAAVPEALPGPDTKPAGLARALLARFSAVAADATLSTRTGPTRAQLVETLARGGTGE
ncbi:FAD-dependent oxidoreductase [Streptomyces sp. NPDC050211]|uniref:FAD-dependent oxidoreductase n=1 Tax=Streptomyces sp. NPDC050211 TaxID=3154932 RepID=UPI0034229CBA